MILESSGWVRGRQGRRAARRWYPALGAPRGTVLFLPPWGDEMNHARPLMAAAARALAAAGWDVRCHDPFGTGDSDGEFAEATLRGWIDDVADDVVDARHRGPVVLWSARQGALLVAPVMAELRRRRKPSQGAHRHPGVSACAAFSPVASGTAALTQWLRIAAMATGERPEVLRARLGTGEAVQVAGYPLTGAFATELVALDGAADGADASRPELDLPRQSWDAATLGLERFWLETEAPLDLTLANRLVDWLERELPTGIDNEATLVGLHPAAPEGEGLTTRAAAISPWPLQLEVPVGAASRPGVLFVVGGPQTRVGAHRQFLRWARTFAAAGHATCRYDRAGRGDADGERLPPESAGAELLSALQQAMAATGVKRWVVFGLCDGATVGLLHGSGHAAVAGVVAVNPWVPAAEEVASQALVSGYYARRWLDPRFWQRLFTGQVAGLKALRGWLAHRARAARTGDNRTVAALPERLLQAVEASSTPTLWILSGKDRTADEFRALVGSSPRWQAALSRTGHARHVIAEADHTLSTAAHHDRVATLVGAWLTRGA